MGSDLFDLDLFEAADALVQALLDVALQDLLASRVLLDELGRVLGTVEGQAERDLVGVLDHVALEVGYFYLKAEHRGSDTRSFFPGTAAVITSGRVSACTRISCRCRRVS